MLHNINRTWVTATFAGITARVLFARRNAAGESTAATPVIVIDLLQGVCYSYPSLKVLDSVFGSGMKSSTWRKRYLDSTKVYRKRWSLVSQSSYNGPMVPTPGPDRLP